MEDLGKFVKVLLSKFKNTDESTWKAVNYLDPNEISDVSSYN
jgi:hypothetical protein